MEKQLKKKLETLCENIINVEGFAEVWTAGQYAGYRAVAAEYCVEGVAFTPTGRAVDELFLLIEQMEKADLVATAEYIKAEIGGDDDDLYCSDEEVAAFLAEMA